MPCCKGRVYVSRMVDWRRLLGAIQEAMSGAEQSVSLTVLRWCRGDNMKFCPCLISCSLTLSPDHSLTNLFFLASRSVSHCPGVCDERMGHCYCPDKGPHGGIAGQRPLGDACKPRTYEFFEDTNGCVQVQRERTGIFYDCPRRLSASLPELAFCICAGNVGTPTITGTPRRWRRKAPSWRGIWMPWPYSEIPRIRST